MRPLRQRRELYRSLDATLPRPASCTPLLVGTKAVRGIAALAGENQHGLVLATHALFHLRKTILEKGGLDESPATCPPPNDPSRLRALAEQIAGAVVTSLATETLYRTMALNFNWLYQAPAC